MTDEGDLGEEDRKGTKRVEKGWVHDLYRVQIAINLSLFSKVRQRRSDAITIRLNILLNGDTDLCPRCSCRCKPIGFSETDALRVVRVQVLPKARTRVKCKHQSVGVNPSLGQGEEVVEVGVSSGREHDHIDDTEDGTDGGGFDGSPDEPLDNRVGLAEAGLASTQVEEQDNRNENIGKHGNTQPRGGDRDENLEIRSV